jgi:hypothetical protein
MNPHNQTRIGARRIGAEGICGRCHGFMVPSSTDSQSLEISEQSATPAWRCVNCGEWVDATITANRRVAQSAEIRRPSNRRTWRW